ncbi:phosphotransferase [Aquihabitans sp. McL0605]|uniref:phosphotransferase n=1 Tax=Aquihabitans sp. McL0605 TaxID=3415671 RepID=UPI003CEFF56D
MEEERGDPRWRAALEVLDRLNSSSSPTTVVREGLSLLVRQDDVLVRVRPRNEEPVAAREVEVARALLAAEVPVAALVGGVGQPWLVEGCVVTAWRWCETVGTASPAHLGHLARTLRESTVGTHAFDVPRFDPLTAIRNAVAGAPIGDEQGDFVRRRVQDLTADWARIADRDPAGTAVVHGDLHADNVLLTADGPLLTDLELAGSGPCSYDTAPAVVMVERYGDARSSLHEFIDAQDHDPRSWHGFTTCLAVYELWVTAWAVGVRDRSPRLAEEAAIRVRCLRDGACEPWHLH